MDLVLRNRELPINWDSNGVSPKEAGSIVTSFLDAATTVFGRATHYNTRAETQVGEISAHESMMLLDRDLYLLMLTLPGLTDRGRALGIKYLLSNRREKDHFLTPKQEREVLYRLMSTLRPDRMLKAMEGFRVGFPELGIKKANNARTRKLTLRLLFNARQLPWWSVRYRKRLRSILIHAWGRKMASAIKFILQKTAGRHGVVISSKEWIILERNINKYTRRPAERVYDCVAFILKVDGYRHNEGVFKAFFEARENIEAGKKLPPEVLEGIRSIYHKDIPHKDILEMTAKSGSMSANQRVKMAREAQKAGVSKEVMKTDLSRLDAVKLYLYGFEMGMTDEIVKLLHEKAKAAAKKFPARYEKLGIVVDASASMSGSREQKLRPLASVLALRDMLSKTAEQVWIDFAGGEFNPETRNYRAQGSTNLAEPLVSVLMHDPDAVFVLSDGYENAPSGQFDDTVRVLRQMGNDTPIFHLNPVFAAEAGGLRKLSSRVPELPANKPDELGVTMIRGLLEADPIRGINTMIGLALDSAPYLQLEVQDATQ